MARWLSPVRDRVAAIARGDVGEGRVVPAGVLRSDPESVVLGTPERPALNTDRTFAVRYVGSGAAATGPANPYGSNERDVIRLELVVSYRYDLDANTSNTRAGVDRQELARCRAGDDHHAIMRALLWPANWGDPGNGVTLTLILADGDHAIEDPGNGVSILSRQRLRVEVSSSRIEAWEMGAAVVPP